MMRSDTRSRPFSDPARYLTTSFSETAGIGGVTYRAEWSEDLHLWTVSSDAGTGTNHVFRESVEGRTRLFMRLNTRF
jgi:hypothetical protein